MTTTDKVLLKFSYLIALQISKTEKPYTIGEDLIKPCMLAAATEVLGPEAANKLQAIPISNDLVKRRIMYMAVDVKEQVIEQVKKSKYFAIQLEESTDLSNWDIPGQLTPFSTFFCRSSPILLKFGMFVGLDEKSC